MTMIVPHDSRATGPRDRAASARAMAAPCDPLELSSVLGDCARTGPASHGADVDPEVAWILLMARIEPILRIARRRRGPVEPDDAAQEIWLALLAGYRRYRRLEGRGGFAVWLGVVARNRLARLGRRERARPEVALDPARAEALIGREEDPALAYERGRARAAVLEALEEARARLSEASHSVVILRWIEGRTVQEIARALGLSPAQVRDRHRRAVPVLRALLGRRLGLSPDHEPCGGVVAPATCRREVGP
jgi:RNA polymerase sigma-70 factor (ECF subfamily)